MTQSIIDIIGREKTFKRMEGAIHEAASQDRALGLPAISFIDGHAVRTTPTESQIADERAVRAEAIANAEASAAHEYGEDFDPGEAYREVRRRVVDGELSINQGLELLVEHARKKASS